MIKYFSYSTLAIDQACNILREISKSWECINDCPRIKMSTVKIIHRLSAKSTYIDVQCLRKRYLASDVIILRSCNISPSLKENKYDELTHHQECPEGVTSISLIDPVTVFVAPLAWSISVRSNVSLVSDPKDPADDSWILLMSASMVVVDTTCPSRVCVIVRATVTTSEEELRAKDGNGLAVTIWVKKIKAIAKMVEVNFMIIMNIWIAQEVLGW